MNRSGVNSVRLTDAMASLLPSGSVAAPADGVFPVVLPAPHARASGGRGLDASRAFVYGARVRQEIRRLFAASVAAKREFLRHNLDRLILAVDLVAAALRDGHTLLLFGNGGSAADAQHIAAEFVNRFKMDRRP